MLNLIKTNLYLGFRRFQIIRSLFWPKEIVCYNKVFATSVFVISVFVISVFAISVFVTGISK